MNPVDPETKKLLDRAIELGEDNNQMLHEMRRSMRLGRIIKAVYWFIIIGSAIGAFFFIQPFLDGILETYSGATDTINQFRGLGQ